MSCNKPERQKPVTGHEENVYLVMESRVEHHHKIHNTPTTTSKHMKVRIRRKFRSIPQNLLSTVQKRARLCIDKNGHQFEHLLKQFLLIFIISIFSIK